MKNLLVLIVFLVLAMAVYWNSTGSSFRYDDNLTVKQNHNIRSLKNIPGFFIDPRTMASDPIRAGHYRPLVVTSYTINYAIGGLNPTGYHFVNILFHAGSAFLIFLIVQAMLGSGKQIPPTPPLLKGGWGDSGFLPALAAGLIFLVHPFNSEVVIYITARSSLMSGFFYLLGFYCWVKYRKQVASGMSHNFQPSISISISTYYYIASLLAFIAGMLSKEVVITLPIMLWLYDLYFQNPPHSAPRTPHFLKWRTYLPYIPFLLLVVIPYMLMRLFSLGKVLDKFQRDSLTQILTEIPVLVKHWQMFIFPKGLSLIHDVKIYHAVDLWVLASFLLILIYIGTIIYLLRLKSIVWRAVSFFMIWFFIVLLPSTVIPLNDIFQENRGYLAIVGFAVLIGAFLVEISRRVGSQIGTGIMVALVVVLSVVTFQRNMIWGDEEIFWQNTIRIAPLSGKAYAALSEAYRNRGDFSLSVSTAEKGISIAPQEFQLHLNLAKTFTMMGNEDRALIEFEKALRIEPNDFLLIYYLVLLSRERGDAARTELYSKRAAILMKDNPYLYEKLGLILKNAANQKKQ